MKNAILSSTRTIGVLVLLLSLFDLSSCQKETAFATTKASGIIRQQGVSTYQYGTHVLTDDTGKTLYALRSKKNLDNYIGKHVEIKGKKVNGYPVENGPEYLEVTKVK
jgi:hypothetical protein